MPSERAGEIRRMDPLEDYERRFRHAGLLTDDLYRREFLDEITVEMRDTFRARAEYLRLRAA